MYDGLGDAVVTLFKGLCVMVVISLIITGFAVTTCVMQSNETTRIQNSIEANGGHEK